MRISQRITAVVAGALATVALTVPAEATLYRNGPFTVSGNFETQNMLRHPSVDKWQFIQQRNTLRLRFDLRLMQNYKSRVGNFQIPGVKSVDVLVLFRPVYDSIYDIKPGGNRRAYPFGANAANAGSFDDFTEDVRDAERNSNAGLNAFREVFVDIQLASNTTIRAGRQQVLWGETDQFRMLDRVNPLDLSWHLSAEPFSELRKPLWMVKALHSFGSIGGLSDVFVEGYWGLGDWTPGERKFFPYPWASPVADPFVNPATCSDPSNTLTCEHFDFVAGTPFRKGDYEKNAIDNGQWGARLVFSTPQQIQFGLHYFYGRTNNDDSSQPTIIKPVDQLGPTPSIATNNLLSIASGTLPVEIIYPYVHTVGLSANYFDGDYTQAVFKFETIYEMDLPFSDRTKPQLITNPACVSVPPGPSCAVAPIVPSGFFGVTESDMWKGMIGFDRPTWVPFISDRNTVTFIVQNFWHYMVEDSDDFRGSLEGLGETRDKIRQWELLTTAAATGFFGPGGKYVPLAIVGVDWVNRYSMIAGWKLDYYVTPNLFLRVFQNYYFVPFYGSAVAQPWPLGGLIRNRDETSLGFVYQF